MSDWNFPSNGGGKQRGIADAGISTFTGKKISSLAREICQNSLDAVKDENFPVTVEFCLHEISTTEMPACGKYRDILRRCRDFWQHTDKARNFFTAALDKLKCPKISVLRISDFNTTGLAEPFNPDAQIGWNTLTKIDGGATKTGDAAGSFGIGKNAPFTNSYLQLVFYRTLNLDGEIAAQGMARLVSFRLDAQNVAAGIGYFGNPQGNMPVTAIDELDKIFPRDDSGTDIFVYGFNGDENWANLLFDALVENFLVAIYRDKLRVKVQAVTLDKQSLGKLVKDNAANYYEILTGDGDIKIFERDFFGMGTVKLRVLCDPKLTLNRKVLIVRKTGMKLFELDRFPRGISFTAILELDGRRLNEFFREMETPSHDSWEPSRYEKNPKLAKKYLDELKRWIRETISNLGADNFSDEVNVEGLSRMLDFDDAAIDGGNSNQVETLDNPAPTENFSLQKLSPTVNTPKTSLTTTGGNDNSKTQRTTGDVTDTGTKPAIRTPTGTRQRKTRQTHTGEENPDGEDIVDIPVGQSVACDKVRVIKVGDKKYRLIVNVGQKISSGYVEIFAVGEDGKREKLSVARANSVDANSKTQALGDKIVFKSLRGGKDAKIIFELADESNYTLEVAVYEN